MSGKSNFIRAISRLALMPKTQHMHALQYVVIFVFGKITAAPAQDDQFTKSPRHRAANARLMGQHLQGIHHVFEQSACQRITHQTKKFFQPLQVGKCFVGQCYLRHVRVLWSWRAAAAWGPCLDDTAPAWRSNLARHPVHGPYQLTACCAMRLQNLSEIFRADRRAVWRQ